MKYKKDIKSRSKKNVVSTQELETGFKGELEKEMLRACVYLQYVAYKGHRFIIVTITSFSVCFLESNYKK